MPDPIVAAANPGPRHHGEIGAFSQKLGSDKFAEAAASTREDDLFSGKRHRRSSYESEIMTSVLLNAPGSRSESCRAALVEITKQIAIKLVKVTRCLDHQGQMPLIYVIDQVLEEFGVADVQISMRREIFKSTLVDGSR